jgi:predicted esterase
VVVPLKRIFKEMNRCAAVVILLATLLSSCSNTSFTDQLYPIGEVQVTRQGERQSEQIRIITSRYGSQLPITLYLPPEARSRAVPVVIENHDRPFKMPVNEPYNGFSDPYSDPYNASNASADSPAIRTFIDSGIAVALPVRRGYYGAPPPDKEGVPCSSPTLEEFKEAGAAAANDMVQAIEFLQSRHDIDKNKIVVSGLSAGGFASIYALPYYPKGVIGVISINGGRCGLRGSSIGGLENLKVIYRRVRATTTTPVLMLYGTNDTTIPPYSTLQLYDSLCAGRGEKCQSTVKLVEVPAATHATGMYEGAGNEMVRFVEQVGAR